MPPAAAWTDAFLRPLAAAVTVPGSGIVTLSVAVPFPRFLFSFPIVNELRALTAIDPLATVVRPPPSVAVTPPGSCPAPGVGMGGREAGLGAVAEVGESSPAPHRSEAVPERPTVSPTIAWDGIDTPLSWGGWAS